MQAFIILALVAAAFADVSHIVRNPEADAKTVSQDADVFPDSYKYRYETSNGITAEASGSLVNAGSDNAAIASQGSYSYPAPNGELIQVTYVAGPDGFNAQGSHLPTPPAPQPIPDYILRSLEYIRTHPPQEDKKVYRA